MYVVKSPRAIEGERRGLGREYLELDGPHSAAATFRQEVLEECGRDPAAARRGDDVERSRSGGRKPVEEIEQDAVEGLRLVEVRGVSGVPDDLEPRPGDLLRHVLARGEEGLVLIADDD